MELESRPAAENIAGEDSQCCTEGPPAPPGQTDPLGKGTFMHCWWGCKLVLHWKPVWGISPKKKKIELLYDPPILLLGIYWGEEKT